MFHDEVTVLFPSLPEVRKKQITNEQVGLDVTL
jgi:hypothetical protein